jgi:hypothetical protein
MHHEGPGLQVQIDPVGQPHPVPSLNDGEADRAPRPDGWTDGWVGGWTDYRVNWVTWVAEPSRDIDFAPMICLQVVANGNICRVSTH